MGSTSSRSATATSEVEARGQRAAREGEGAGQGAGERRGAHGVAGRRRGYPDGGDVEPLEPLAGRPPLDPSVARNLSRMYTSHRTSNSSGTSHTSGATHETNDTNRSSSINDAFSPEVTNMACAYGHLRFANGAIFQGIICNRVEGLNEDEVDRKELETLVANFLTKDGECLHGVWLFQRLSYDMQARSPVASYSTDLKVLLQDSSVHIYKGPVQVMLKNGRIVLPLAKQLLGGVQPRPSLAALECGQFDEQFCAPAEASFGGEALPAGHSVASQAPVNLGANSTSGQPEPLSDRGSLGSIPANPSTSTSGGDGHVAFTHEVEYAKYPIASPRGAAFSTSSEGETESGEPRRTPRRRLTTSAASQDRGRPNIRRDHRVLFWSLVGKEMARSKWDDSINSDLHRTHFHRFLDRSADSAREQLHSILRYVAVAFPGIGYCQGMHCVAKFLLMFSEAPAQKPEAAASPNAQGGPAGSASGSGRQLNSSVMLETETAFVLFAQLLEDTKYRLQDLFHPGFAFYRSVLDDIDKEIARREPVLAAHLADAGLCALVYAAKWVLTLFTFYVDQDFSSVTNVWLRFLSQGWDAILQVAVASVCGVKEHLLNTDAEGCILILSGTTDVTPHGILETVFGTTRGQALLGDKGMHVSSVSEGRSMAEERQHERQHERQQSGAVRPRTADAAPGPFATETAASAGTQLPAAPPLSPPLSLAPLQAEPSELHEQAARLLAETPKLESRAVPNRRYTQD